MPPATSSWLWPLIEIVDSTTLKVVWDRLVGICHDASATMERTTFSPVVREGHDYCCSLIDAKGRQVAVPADTPPSFTGTLPITVRHFLDRFPLQDLEPGDSIITNDPWIGTGHLNDLNVSTPVFDRQGKVVAMATSVAHMTDVGGSSVLNRGLTRDLHEEGLRIPVCKVVRGGKLNDELIEILSANVRMPDACVGDLMGMLAANRTMTTRLLELLDDAEITDFESLAEQIYARSERAMREAVAVLPSGQHRGTATVDGPGFDLTIEALVEINDGRVRVDYTGSTLQRDDSALNVAMNYTYAQTVFALKLLLEPRLPGNDGSLRPFQVFAPAGSILNSRWPAAGYTRQYGGHVIHAAIFSALEKLLPDRVWAHSGSAPSAGESLAGRRPDGSTYVSVLFLSCGGTGAMPEKDGESCYFPSNVYSTSIESAELQVPILFEEKAIIQDSGGIGAFRGGLGSRWTLVNIGTSTLLYSGMAGRLNHPAEGLLGGGPGHPNRLFVNGQREKRGWGRWALEPGDSFTKESPGGGGLGNPLFRSPDLVVEDVLEGYVSSERAVADYGVIVENGQLRGFSEARRSLQG